MSKKQQQLKQIEQRIMALYSLPVEVIESAVEAIRAMQQAGMPESEITRFFTIARDRAHTHARAESTAAGESVQ